MSDSSSDLARSCDGHLQRARSFAPAHTWTDPRARAVAFAQLQASSLPVTTAAREADLARRRRETEVALAETSASVALLRALDRRRGRTTSLLDASTDEDSGASAAAGKRMRKDLPAETVSGCPSLPTSPLVALAKAAAAVGSTASEAHGASRPLCAGFVLTVIEQADTLCRCDREGPLLQPASQPAVQ
jgi:hypothetical protein